MDALSSLWMALPSLPRTLIAFVVVLGVLVFIHELGHYLAARWRGVRVDVFSIGFGKPILRWTDSRDCEWRISWIPLGGFVKLHGQENPAEVTPEQRATWRPGETFHDKPVGSRAIVVAAGPIANFLLAILLFAGLFMAVGKPIGGTGIGQVVAGSAAERGGLRPGDEIQALDGNRVQRFDQVQRYVQPRAGQPIAIRVLREGGEVTLTVTPEAAGEGANATGRLGIQGGAGRFERLGPIEALSAGMAQTWDIIAQTVTGIGEMLTGQRSAKELGGPIRIAEISGEAANLGLMPLINLMAVLSVSLGLINLFPIPVLDGGHLMFYAAEAIRGRPLPPKVQEYGFRAGFALLIALFLFASGNDIIEGGIGKWFARMFG